MKIDRATAQRLQPWITTPNLAVAALLSGFAVQTCAQQAAQNSPSTPEPLPAVTITGQPIQAQYSVPNASAGTKTDTPLMETPVNVQVVSKQVMLDQGATSLDQILTNVSGVISNTQYGNGQLDIIIRGFDTGSEQFVDGVRIYDHFGNGLLTISDIDRVEVLKGPAAILYGSTEPGGIVNVVTKRPLAVPYHELEMSYGSWDHQGVAFDVNTLLAGDKTVALRIDGSYEYTRSFRDGVWSRTEFVSPSLRWQITPMTDLMVKYAYEHNPLIPDNGQVVPLLADGTLVSIPRNVNLYDPGAVWQVNDMSRLLVEVQHHFDENWALMTRLTQYSAHSKGVSVNGSAFYPPGTPGNIDGGWDFQLGYPNYNSGMASYQDADERTSYAGLDLTGHFNAFGARHTLLLGLDFTHYAEPALFESDVTTTGEMPIIPVDRTVYEPIVLDPNNLTQSNSVSNDGGVYVQDQIKVGDFDVLAGLRYQHWHENSSWYNTYGSTDVADGQAGFTPGSPYVISSTTPRLGAVWEAQKWLSAYALYAGGFLPNVGYDYLHHTLKATSAVDEEAGVKFESLDHRLQASFTVFDLTKTNLPTPDLVHFDAATNSFDFTNTIGQVRSRGAELDVRGQIRPNWDVVATYAFVDARVTVDPNSVGTTGIASTVGNLLGNSPLRSGSLWTTYRFPMAENGAWQVGGGIVARSSTLDGTNTIRTPGYAIANLMIGYSQRWNTYKVTAQLNVNNVANTTYFTNSAYDYGAAGAWPFAGVAYGRPREYFGTVRLEF